MWGFRIRSKYYNDINAFCENNKIDLHIWNEWNGWVEIEFHTSEIRDTVYAFYDRILELEQMMKV